MIFEKKRGGFSIVFLLFIWLIYALHYFLSSASFWFLMFFFFWILKLGVEIIELRVFLFSHIFSAIDFSLSADLRLSHQFCYVVFPYFIQFIILFIFFYSFSLHYKLFRSLLFSFQIFKDFSVIFYSSSLISFWSENTLCMILMTLIHWGGCTAHNMVYPSTLTYFPSLSRTLVTWMLSL